MGNGVNPYRKIFYSRQAERHGLASVESARAAHEARCSYYRWYTRGWLPNQLDATILDLGCGAGQFPYFLRASGYTDVTGVDVDGQQVGIARELGLTCVCASALDFLTGRQRSYDLVVAFDLLEHFRLEELRQLLALIVGSLKPEGRLIGSVVNAESPVGYATLGTDITHEIAFTPVSLGDVLECHGMRLAGIRDPHPAPVDLARKSYRALALVCRRVEALRLRALGLGPPVVWSSMFVFNAELQRNREPHGQPGRS
jgi:2-polyprenyl-3-methyl-5-hydroxy-6-metoxy-1,4-benzoquinol methylase